jgi:hypothetical protein
VLGDFVDLHPTGLFHYEEDEMLLLHCFSSPYLVFFFPLYGLFRRFGPFDEEVEASRRRRILEFYRRCLMRQAYVRGAGRTHLSKNPMFSGKIESVRERFPDCRFVYMIRSPLEAIPSMLSEGHASCVFGDRSRPPSREFQEQAYELAKMCYRYPVERKKEGRASITVVAFDALIREPKATIVRLYQELGYTVSPSFLEHLEREEEKAKRYQSKHRYSIDQFAITADRIRSDFQDVIEELGVEKVGRS